MVMSQTRFLKQNIKGPVKGVFDIQAMFDLVASTCIWCMVSEGLERDFVTLEMVEMEVEIEVDLFTFSYMKLPHIELHTVEVSSD